MIEAAPSVDPRLATECLLAVVGLRPEAITSRQIRAATTLPETFAKRAAAWWTAERAPFKDVQAPKDLDKLFDDISVPPPQSQLSDWLRSAGDDVELIEDLHLALGKARAYLVAKWPRIVIQTFAGPRLMPLGVDDAAEVASLFAVLNEPTRILDEMDFGALTDSQAQAFRQNFPALAAWHRTALQTAAAKRTAKDADWMPDETQEIMLGILVGQPPGLIGADAGPPSPAPRLDEKDLGAKAASTQADLSSKPKSAQK